MKDSYSRSEKYELPGRIRFYVDVHLKKALIAASSENVPVFQTIHIQV